MLILTTHLSIQVIRPLCRDSPPRLELCVYCACAHLLPLMHCYNASSNCYILSQVLYTATTLTEYDMWGSLTLAPHSTSYWGEHELAPPIEFNVPPVYIYIVLVPVWPHATRKRKVHPSRSGIRSEHSVHL